MPQYSFIDVLNARRSLRAFTQQTIAPELMQQIFSQAQQAPSNCNRQPWG
ncbi:MAG: hypothetical protein HOE45_05055 [Gammaproteobacteria bacterium]|jgi:nitroreductase|nr:hypothetical protein [Gammaproteobacteria bacterium]MBT4146237.1 hypothetical protein [Gammaproteobacteria bacterium]MBT5221400.1 hypothetical protein [Gammaproteobacteria bacterium]MBT5825268.1 hypothetical protein [Gammaproteobacteria bacterium]MBT5966789.1 hypothetical protein [Gammaproteobacteria bacterium]